MNLSTEQLLEIAQYSFVRMDGAWFIVLARKLGKKTAWEIDVEAWSQFSYVFGKEMGILVQHTKNLNQGDDCCEVIISRKTDE